MRVSKANVKTAATFWVVIGFVVATAFPLNAQVQNSEVRPPKLDFT